MTSSPRSPPAGSRRAIAHERIILFVLPYLSCAPFVAALAVALSAFLLAPDSLHDTSVHREWDPFFETSALLVGALLVGLVVEVRRPFARAGEPAIRIVTVGTAVMLGAAGLGAVLAMIPSLTGWI